MSKPLFWISGNLRQSRKTWDTIVAHIKSKTGEDVKVETLFCGPNPKNKPPSSPRWATAGDVIQLLRSQNLFDSRPRIIKVCGLPEDYKDITDWLDYVKGTDILIFWGPFGFRKLGSKRWVSGKLSTLFKKIKSEGKVFEHPLEAKTESDAVSWIKAIFTELGKKIEGVSARRMVQLQGQNLDLLENSVLKISVYQKGKVVSTEDVEACCYSDYKDDQVWTFLENLDYQKSDAALAYLATFYAEGKGSIGEQFYGRIMRLFGALLQHYQFLMMLKDVCGKSIDPQVARKALATFKKTTPTKLEELREGKITIDDLESRFSPQYVESNVRSQSVQAAFRRRKGEIYTIVSNLYNCMYWARRYSGNVAMLRICLDTFVLQCCGKITFDEAKQIRGGRKAV